MYFLFHCLSRSTYFFKKRFYLEGSGAAVGMASAECPAGGEHQECPCSSGQRRVNKSQEWQLMKLYIHSFRCAHNCYIRFPLLSSHRYLCPASPIWYQCTNNNSTFWLRTPLFCTQLLAHQSHHHIMFRGKPSPCRSQEDRAFSQDSRVHALLETTSQR